jgi:phenylalanyl-tRNA synthetase beta chain
VDRGYQEAITYSFVDENIQQLIAPNDEYIRIQNPISSELAIMRTSLWCGLINAALYNINRQQQRVRLFETGLRFLKQGESTEQSKMLAGLALGSVHAEQWAEKSRPVDYFDVKADVEAFLALSGVQAKFTAGEHPALHPGQTALITNAQGESIGWLGMLHPNLEKQLGFDGPVFLFELLQEAVLGRVVPKFEPLSKFPSVRRDMALLVEDSVSAAAIIEAIQSAHEPKIRDVQLFDIYCGPGVADGFKSVALSLILQDYTQTLTDTEIDAIFSNVLEILASKHNAKLRD